MRTTTTTTTRRTAIKRGAAALAGSGLALGGLTLFGSRGAHAAVTTSMTLPDAGVAEEDGHATPWLSVSGSYSYSGLEVEPDGYRIRVQVSKTGDNWDRLAVTEGVPFGYDGEGVWDVFAPLTDAANFTSDTFQAPDTGAIVVDVYCRAVLEVLDGDTVLISASAEDHGTLGIEDTTSPGTANVSGSATWAFQADETDPTPTPP